MVSDAGFTAISPHPIGIKSYYALRNSEHHEHGKSFVVSKKSYSKQGASHTTGNTTTDSTRVCLPIMSASKYTFVVEHLDPELGPWSALEYTAIAKESAESNCDFILSSLPQSLSEDEEIKRTGATLRTEPVEVYFADKKDRICLLDPKAKEELQPSDASKFDVFLFGGILGTCLSMKK